MKNVKPILVTGCHRSGSTWVGNVLAKSPSVSYIHEPFNGMCRPGKCRVIFPHTYMYITQANEENYYDGLNDTLNFKYNIPAELKFLRTPRDLARLTRDYLIFFYNQLNHISPLVKDPMAVLSAEWLAHRFQMNVLVLVRHPAAFVSSCKQLGWGFHFENLLHQPLLIDKYFKQFEAEIIDHVNYEHELIDKLTLLWKLIYTAVIDYQDNNPEWLILRYEDICSQPLSQFNHIFKTFNIEFSTTAQKFIQESTNYSQFKGIFK
ncbi:MAG: sulfotransferase [Moorea sp. SIO1F2]|uniref:sulfotransferase n=1 Tax=Moorena sp. SIO1F2 TaxID=2607819 RepID=UPI0013B90F72|nr:sulfotransferase [Moorena sp. SIO1F2]NET85957.1 sulfotransferase [Moorena sp. SIO1F2]